MNEELKLIHKNISAVHDGQPWYGDNIQTLLSGVSAKMASQRPENLNHNIAEIVSHISAWHLFVIEKMKGNGDYEVWDTELNWQKINSLTETEWQKIREDLKISFQLLLKQIGEAEESLLSQTVTGRHYNFRLMLQGIAQHDIYHSGQISMIKRLVS